MNQKQLEIFVNLAETLNFRKTAEQMFLSQTTVTFQIQSLEDELAARLFHRDRHSVSLTDEGRVFKEHAKEILRLMEQSVKEVADVSEGYTGHITIGFCVDTTKAGISELIRSFTKENPKIKVELLGSIPSYLFDALSAERCDLIFTPYSVQIKDDNFEYYEVGRYDQIAAFNKDHRFAHKKSLKFKDFDNEMLIGVSNVGKELDFTKDFISGLEKNNTTPKNITFSDNIDTVFLMLEANLGVTVIPDYFSERLSGDKKIKTCRLDEDLNGTTLVAVRRKKKITPELEQFIKILQEHFPL